MIGAAKGLGVDEIAASPEFAAQRIGRTFRERPLGFIDVGSLGGVHPVVDPAASLVQVLCFEPDEAAHRALQAQYAGGSRFAGVTVRREALAGTAARGRPLYVAVTPTNTSLLEPNPRFISRYAAHRFDVEKVVSVDTHRLDDVAFEPSCAASPFGELIKLDTQGSEHEILDGAARILRERCVAVVCEVEFFQVYRGQNTLTDIDHLLRASGFALYGVYPHYRSTKALDPAASQTEERLMWADAVFFKDPLDDRSADRKFNGREIDCLILCALLTGFLDFAIEICNRYIENASEREAIIRVARQCGERSARALSSVYASWQAKAGPNPTYLEIRRFVDANYRSGSADYLSGRLDTP